MNEEKYPSRILKFIYLGGKQQAKTKEILQELNITHILNCTPTRSVDPEAGCPNFFEKERLFTYKRIPIFDNKGEDILSHMETAINFIEHSKHYGNILIHCHKGVSRSASFVIGYLMKKNEMTLDEALNHVKSIRSIVQPNETFISQLRKYEQQLITERDTALAVEESFNNKISRHLNSTEENQTKRQRIEISVGPELPPHLQSQLQPQPQVEIIGPSMPPEFNDNHNDNQNSNCDSVDSGIKNSSIIINQNEENSCINNENKDT